MIDPATADRVSRIARFNPGYTWPNEAFPFRLYLDHPKCRIFIIECFTHNWKWMSRYYRGFRESDFFLVYIGWDQTSGLAKSARAMIDTLGVDPEQFCVLANSEAEVSAFGAVGIPAEFINHNAWLDETGAMQPRSVEKLYNAIYVGRLVPGKRHHLAANVPNLALVAGNPHQKSVVEPPPHAFLNTTPLPREQVAEKINQSHVGLLLSEIEGACYSSSEYLLCGLPVVSTPSRGGRDVWYNEYNSLIVEAKPDAVAAGVEAFLRSPRDPQRIRAMHIEQAQSHRRRFILLLSQIFARYGVSDISAEDYFRENYFDKMKSSSRPLLHQYFGAPTHEE